MKKKKDIWDRVKRTNMTNWNPRGRGEWELKQHLKEVKANNF